MIFIEFDSAGWMFPFGFGVAAYIQDNFETDTLQFGGTSAGACCALALAARVPIRPYFEDAINVNRFNPFRMADAVKDVLVTQKYQRLPDTGQVRIGLSEANYVWQKMRRVVVQEFEDWDHAVECVRASCHLPILAGFRGYSVGGRRYFDGGCTRVAPPRDTVFVSPWTKSSENCIGTDVRFPKIWSYFPPRPQVLQQIFRLGYIRSELFFRDVKKLDKH